MIWEDAQFEADLSCTAEELDVSTNIEHSMGFLIRQNKKEVVIAMGMDPNDKSVRFTLTIPKTIVREIVELERKNAKESSNS